jgi:predicted dehydrogenase
MAIKTVIIGFGGHARGSWFNNIKKHPDFKLEGIIDSDTELLENVPKMIPGLTEDDCFMSIDDYVEMKGKPDLAIIATPIYTHHILVTEAMELGINVICEKNMASTIYQGRQMVQAAIDHPELSTAIGTQYRYFTKFWTAHKFFTTPAENPIGDISYIRWESAGNWGEKRRGWRRWLPEVYLEDMCTHWFDLLRYITGMDVVQVKCDSFIPKYSNWKGSSTTFVNLALANKKDYDNRHNWVWAQLYGDWQARGKNEGHGFHVYCEKGQAKITDSWGLELQLYKDADGHNIEEDGYMPQANIENLGTDFTDQAIILEMTKRCIQSKGKNQPGTNFKEAFKSFAISMAAIDSSRTGQSIWVPDYWKGFLD